MSDALPHGAAIVVLGPSGMSLGRRVRDLLPGAQLYGPRDRGLADGEQSYDGVVSLLAELFAAGRPIVGLCASGILIRALAPLVADKRAEPPVVALAEDGSVAVPLLGGHRGANTLARAIAAGLGGAAAITTAGDLTLGFALDEPPPGWRIANPERVKPTAAALLAGAPMALIEEAAAAAWLRSGAVVWNDAAARNIIVTDRVLPNDPTALVLHPPVLAVGIGCERWCPAEEIVALAQASLAEAGFASGAVAAVVSIELKTDEPGIHALAAMLGAPARFFSAARLLAETGRLTVKSAAAFDATGCWGVAEGAALAAAGAEGALVVARRQSAHATCAIARAAAPIDARTLGRARGRLALVGIGPGDPMWRTPEASTLIAASDHVLGYSLYLDLLGAAIAGKQRHDGAIGAEEARTRQALELAAAGGSVALVSSGDPGIYGLAALVFELLDRERRRDWSAVEIVVAPGVSAMQAAAARLGAPLGHDFCAISLSDLLTPWAEIAARVEAAASADFVIALYNPRSSRRPGLLAQAAAIMATHRPPDTPCAITRNLGRSGETLQVLPLVELTHADADMLSLVIVGNRRTRLLAGGGPTPRLYTPRGYFVPTLPSPAGGGGSGRGR
jgi:cobalt-precorrin 5A hydrolase / precorrin-3B C17-methyltransferase